MTRQQALAVIRAEVAQHGQMTGHATRIYIEHRISRAVLNETIQQGAAIFRRMQTGETYGELVFGKAGV